MDGNKVVIEFTEQGIEDIADKLVKIGAVDAKAAADFKQANAAFKERQTIVDSTTKSMSDLATASTNVTKNITNAATNNAIKQTGELIDKNTESLGKYSGAFGGLRAQYQELIAKAVEAGETTPFGRDFLQQAGEVRLRIDEIRESITNYGAKTQTLNAIGEGIRGIGAGFELAQGSQALFGKGNEDLEKSLVKIQATMALVNGLTELQSVLMKESALRQGLSNAATAIRNSLEGIGITLKTTENGIDEEGNVIKSRTIEVQAIDNALQSESAVVRGLATAAQWALNNAMLAFPLLAIIAGLAVVIGLFGGFGDSLDKSAEQQIKLNTAAQENLKIMQAQDDFINKLSSDRVEQLQRELDLLKSQQASTDDIRAKENQLQQTRNQNAQFQAGNHAVEIYDLERNRIAVAALTAQLADYNKEKANTGSDDYDKTIESIKGKLEIAQELVKQGEEAKKAAADATLEGAKQRIEQENQIEEEGLAYQKDIIDSKLRFAKEGSQMQLALQLAAAKNEYDTAIANLKATNESTADIEAAYQEKRLNIQEQYNALQLQKKLSLINAELTQVRVGSSSELDLKLKALDVQSEAELNNRKLTDEKREELTANYLKKVHDTLADFAKKQTDDELNTQLLIIDAKLQAQQKGAVSELNLKQQQLAVQEQLELNNIDKNIQGTELGEAKKSDIIAKYAAQNRQLEIDAIKKVIDARQAETTQLADFLQKQSALEANNVNTSLQRKEQLELDAFDNKLVVLEKEGNADTDRYLAGAISFEEYQKDLTKIQDQEILNREEKQNLADEIEKKRLERKANQAAQIANDALNAASTISQTELAIQQAAYDKDTAANEAAHTAKLETDAQYAANTTLINKRLADAKKKAAQQDKEIALFQIAINTAQAAIKAWANSPFPLGAIESALAIAFGAIQYAAVSAKPIPQYAKGTKNAPKGWAWVGEKGPELVWMKGGEEVKPHEDSVKFARDYNKPLKRTYADKIDRSPIPSPQAERAIASIANNNVMDIKMLSKLIGNEVGVHLNKMPLTLMSFDKNGFQASITQGNSTTKFLNSRYSSR